MFGLVGLQLAALAGGPLELETCHRGDEEVAAGELEEQLRGCHPPDVLDRVDRSHRREVVDPVLLDRPEREEPVGPAGHGGDQRVGGRPAVGRGEERRVHRTEIVPDDADPGRIDRRPAHHDVEAAPKPVHLGGHALAVRGRAGWIALPGERQLRQDRRGVVTPRPVDGLVNELRPVAVGRLGVEPVGEEQARPSDPGVHDRGLDEVRLDGLTRAAGRHPDVPNEDAVASLVAGDLEHGRSGTGGGFAGRSVAHGPSLAGRARAGRQPVLEPEPLASERQEPRAALVRRRHERELQARQRRRRIARQPAADRRPE